MTSYEEETTIIGSVEMSVRLQKSPAKAGMATYPASAGGPSVTCGNSSLNNSKSMLTLIDWEHGLLNPER